MLLQTPPTLMSSYQQLGDVPSDLHNSQTCEEHCVHCTQSTVEALDSYVHGQRHRTSKSSSKDLIMRHIRVLAQFSVLAVDLLYDSLWILREYTDNDSEPHYMGPSEGSSVKALE